MNENLTGWKAFLPGVAIFLLVGGGSMVELIAQMIAAVAW